MDLLQLLSYAFVFVVPFDLEIAEPIARVVLNVLLRLFRVGLHLQALRLFDGLLGAPAEGLSVLLALRVDFFGLGLAGREWFGCGSAVELDGFWGLPPWHRGLPAALLLPGWLAVGVEGGDGEVPLLVAGALPAAGALLVGLPVLVAAGLRLFLSRPGST